jgi:hypothetical protein
LDLEARVLESAKLLSALAQTDPLPLDQIKTASRELLPRARSLAQDYRNDFSARIPELSAWLKDRNETQLSELTQAPIVLIGNATEADVIACFHQQLKANLIALGGLAVGDPAFREWLYWDDMAGARASGRPFFRAEQLRDCLREIQKLLSLLTLDRSIIRPAAGKKLFSDDFSRELPQWKTFGGAQLSRSENSLRVKGMGVTVWCEQPFGDALVAFDYRPLIANGESYGALFAFPGAPVPGKDLSVSAGDMPNYNRGIDTYHVSLFRGSSGKTNLRRTGIGLKMLSTVQPDACGELGRKYRVELLKFGRSAQVFVDGRLIHAYVDVGVYGPPRESGCFGLRHFSGQGEFETEFANFQITELT